MMENLESRVAALEAKVKSLEENLEKYIKAAVAEKLVGDAAKQGAKTHSTRTMRDMAR